MPLVGNASLAGNELEDFRQIGERVLQVRMSLKLPKMAAKRHMLCSRQVLVGEKQHEVFH
jgi:hypothetical protein